MTSRRYESLILSEPSFVILAVTSLVVAIDLLKAPVVTDPVIAEGLENHRLLSRRKRVLNTHHLRPHLRLTSRKARHRLEVLVPQEASRNEQGLRESGDRDLPVLLGSIVMCPVEAVTAPKRIVNASGNDESYEPRKGRRKANLSSSGTNRSSLVRSGEIETVIGHGIETETGKASDHGNATEIEIGTTKDVIETKRGIEITIGGTEIETVIVIVSGTDQGSEIVTEIGSGAGRETGTETMNGETATRIETMIGGIAIEIVTETDEVVVHGGGRRGETTGGMRDEKISGKGKGKADETANPIVSPGVKERTRTMYRLIGIFQEEHDDVFVHQTPSSTSLQALAMQIKAHPEY